MDSAVRAQRAITQTPRPRPGLYTLHTDGGIVATPGQPAGEAAIGAVLKNSDNLLGEAISKSIGYVDNHHVAEFRALIEGWRWGGGTEWTKSECSQTRSSWSGASSTTSD
jgi:hypothetical protein